MNNTLLKLNDFEAIKRPLLKNWNNYEMQTKHAYYTLKHNISSNLNYADNAGVHSYEREAFWNDEKLERVFGLPYTSSGDFAGIWNCNTQAWSRYGKKLYFRAVAIDEANEAVLIFYDDKEKYYYFNDFEFSAYMEQERERQSAIDYCNFVKNSNDALYKAVQIINKYAGRKLGEKTKQAINNELATAAKVNCYIDHEGSFKTWACYSHQLTYYLHAVDEATNTIQKIDPAFIQPKTEYNANAIFNRLPKQRKAIQKKASELLKMIKAFRSDTQALNFELKEISNIYSIELETLATYWN